VIQLKRLKSRGRDIGAAAHGFSKDHLGGVGPQAFGSVHHGRKQTAEAPAHDLVRLNALRLNPTRVGEFCSLIVQDSGCSNPSLLKDSGSGQD